MITRRKVLLAIGAGAASAPLHLLAQQTKSMPVVGVINLEVGTRVAQLREGLRTLGYVEGRNIRIEERAAGDRYERLADIADEYVRLKVDVIVAMGNTATEIARKATSTIPIVMTAGVDPVKSGLAASLSRPGGNVTGLSTILQELTPKRLEMTKEAVPGLSRVGILWNPDSKSSTASFAQAQVAAKALNLQLQVAEARTSGDFDKALQALFKAGIKVVIVLDNSMFTANRKQLTDSAKKHRLAAVISSPGSWADSGYLLAYGTNSAELYRHAAVYVDKILKGAKPGDLPIEQPTKFELIVNMKLAKSLRIKIPQSILLRADKVIE